MRIHLVANVHRPDAMDAAMEAARWMRKKNIDVAVEPETGRLVKLPVVSSEEFPCADYVIAFGGDGTLIRAAHLCSELGTPILGVYYGRFGFVTQCRGAAFQVDLAQLVEGAFKIESRLMVEARLTRGGQEVASLYALNEIVLQRSISARMMIFNVCVDGHDLTSYPADGVMVCTPTGSTAYNLSAGGPVVDPNVQALLVTALAPHTLSSRTLVLRPDSEVLFKVERGAGEAVLSADAQTRLHVLAGDEVRIKRSARVTNLVAVKKDDFLVKLGELLMWSRGLGDPT